MMRQNDHLKRSESMYKCSGNMSVVKWQDNKPVTFLKTAVSPKSVTTVPRNNKDCSTSGVYCPKVVDILQWEGLIDLISCRRDIKSEEDL